MLKNAYFLQKSVKFAPASGTPPPNRRLPLAETPDPRFVTPAYYYNHGRSLPKKKNLSSPPSPPDEIRSLALILWLNVKITRNKTLKAGCIALQCRL